VYNTYLFFPAFREWIQMIPQGITVGRFFRKSREEKKVTLESVARETRIKMDFLQAIEDDSFQLIPCQAYIKGFIRNYAKSMHLDVKEVLDLYNLQVEPQKTRAAESANSSPSVSKSLNQIKNHLFDFLTTMAGGTLAYPLGKTILRPKD
jgi:cytoskeletal protein RodZ